MRPGPLMLALALVAVGAAAPSAQAGVMVYSSHACVDAADQQARPGQRGGCAPAIWAALSDGSHAFRLTTGAPDGPGDTDPVWSPDGSRIVYESQQPENLYWGQPTRLWEMNANGSNQHALTAGGDYFSDSGPAFSPDGRLIAFASTRTGPEGNLDSGIYVMDPDGNVRRVDALHGLSTSPSWTPDGKRIVFLNKPGGDSGPITLLSMAVDGSDVESVLGGDFLGGRGAFSPDGRYFALNSDAAVFAINLQGGTIRQISPVGSDLDGWLVNHPETLRVAMLGSQPTYYDLDLTKSPVRHVGLPAGAPDGRERPTSSLGPQPFDWPPAVFAAIQLQTGFLGGSLPPDPWAMQGRSVLAATPAHAGPLSFVTLATTGIRSVRVSLARRLGHGRCRFLVGSRLRRNDRCGRTHFVPAGTAAAWTARAARLPYGTYEVRFQATDAAGRRSRLTKTPTVVVI